MGMLGRILVSHDLVLADFVFRMDSVMIFWFRRSSTKHVVIKYTIYAEVHITIILPVSDRGWVAYRWYIALLQQKVFVISQNACIIDHNYDRVCANILFASAEVISANWCTVRVRRHPKHRPKAARPEFLGAVRWC